MFDSGISVKELVDELKNTEVDIALDIPNATYVSWLNSLQQLIYTEVIKEQKRVTISEDIQNPLDISAIKVDGKENKPRFEDIYAIYTDDGTQLIKSSVTSGIIFPNTFFKDNNNIGYNTAEIPSKLHVVYIVKPALIQVDESDEIDNSNVMLPIEFIDIAKSKLRGEAYKLVNEDGIAAKWLNDYNVLMETFKAWAALKSYSFGL
jgi:hypothetical protein